MDEVTSNFKELLDSKIVTPIKGHFDEVNKQLAELSKQNKNLKIWLACTLFVALVALVFAIIAFVKIA